MAKHPFLDLEKAIFLQQLCGVCCAAIDLTSLFKTLNVEETSCDVSKTDVSGFLPACNDHCFARVS